MPNQTSIGPVLLREITRIVERIASARVEEAKARYDLGVLLHAIRYAPLPEYGSRPIEEIATRLHVDPSGLRRYARVAEVIRPDEFRSYMVERTGPGGPLAWAHLERLSQVASATRRRTLADAAIRENLSVRCLDALIRTAAPPRASAEGPSMASARDESPSGNSFPKRPTGLSDT
jgi:hypothetical protein